jgi:hypothetical protein
MNLIEFLETYTKINNNFINDFFRLYDPNDKYNFAINLENIAKWMDTNKSDLKRTLLNSYKEKLDYKIIKGKSNGLKGKPKDIT